VEGLFTKNQNYFREEVVILFRFLWTGLQKGRPFPPAGYSYLTEKMT